MEEAVDSDEFVLDINWDESELDYSDDDSVADPDYVLAEMLDQANLDKEVESDAADSANPNLECEQTLTKKTAKRRRAQTIDTRPKKRKRGCLMSTTYSETDVDIEVIPNPSGKFRF